MLGKINSKLDSLESEAHTYRFKRYHFFPVLVPLLILFLSLPLLIIAVKTSTNSFSNAQTLAATSTELNETEDTATVKSISQPKKITSRTSNKPLALAADTASNPIVTENQQPGTNAWAQGNSPLSSDSNLEIKGYADKTSVNLGDSINFNVTVHPAQSFNMEIYRMGWYQGLGGRLMMTVGPLTGISQPACTQNSTTKMVSCDWSSLYTLTVPTTWTTGTYIVKLINSNGYINYIPFTVRDDSSHSDILLQNSTNTWQAYNGFGGASLYPPGQNHGVKVTYDRPYGGTGMDAFLKREIQMVRFLEREGYDLSYTTDVDTHERGNLILNHKAFVEMGHDEYWTWQMRDAVESARDKGVNLAFFGGNESYWQVRYEADAAGNSDRVIVGYKEQYAKDPYYQSTDPNVKKLTSSLFRYSFENRPEQLMMGEQFGTNLGTESTHINYIVKNASNWIYAGTGATEGQVLTSIMGKEINRVYSSAKPANKSFTIVSRSTSSKGAVANSVIYQSTSGAWVFAAGTMDWSHGLDDYASWNGVSQVSPIIQQVTRNILNKFVASTTPSPTPTPSVSSTPTPTPGGSSTGFQEVGGQVAFEAEHFTANIARNSHTWSSASDSLASNSTYINTPDANLTFTPPNSAETQYSVYFNDPGTYYVWLRGYAPSTNSNISGVGVDGSYVNGIELGSTGKWAWSDKNAGGTAIMISVPAAGTHTFSLFEKRDGTRIDKIVLSTSSVAPTGTGPGESAKK